MRIAIDFDLAEHRDPAIGRKRPLPSMPCKQKSPRLIFCTCRCGPRLDEAVKHGRSQGIEFYAANKIYREQKGDQQDSRNRLADSYIDDCNLGGLLSRGEIYNQICPQDQIQVVEQQKSRW